MAESHFEFPSTSFDQEEVLVWLEKYLPVASSRKLEFEEWQQFLDLNSPVKPDGAS